MGWLDAQTGCTVGPQAAQARPDCIGRPGARAPVGHSCRVLAWLTRLVLMPLLLAPKLLQQELLLLLRKPLRLHLLSGLLWLQSPLLLLLELVLLRPLLLRQLLLVLVFRGLMST